MSSPPGSTMSATSSTEDAAKGRSNVIVSNPGGKARRRGSRILANSPTKKPKPRYKYCRPTLSRTTMLRLLLTASLLVAIAICTAVSFSVLKDAEHQVGRLTYESIAASGLAGAQAITLRKIQGSQVMATLLAQTFPTKLDWPLISMDGYIPIAESVAQLTASTTQSLMVLLELTDEEVLPEFEQHTAQVFRDQKRPLEAGVNDFGFGVWKPDPNKKEKTCDYDDCRLHDTSTDYPSSWKAKRNIATPLMLHNQPAASSLLYNLYSQENRGVHIDSMLDCVQNATTSASPHCAVITDILELKIRPGPAGLLFQPIYPAQDPTTIVGFATTSIHWEEVLTTTFPDFVSGVTCVVSTDTQAYTYEIRQGVPVLMGVGDLHHSKYQHYGQSVILNEEIETGALSSSTYTLTVYPTADYFDSFATNSPVAVSLGFFAVVAFCTFIFVLYDRMMRTEAHQRNAILDMKRRFVRFISHEIRTPLNTVCMGLELLESELKSPRNKCVTTHSEEERVQTEDVDFWYTVCTDIQANAQTAVEILNDLLNYDKLEMGTLTLETGTVCIFDLVERTVQQFQIQAVNRNVKLQLDLVRPKSAEGDLECGGGTEHLALLGDDVKLGQVLRNLISNALKFTPADGSIQVTTTHIPNGLPKAEPILLSGKDEEPVYSSDYPRAGSIQIKVKDTGIGLTNDQLEQLFEEGVQFDANRLQHGGGSGLGLCIAKGILEQHSGTITAESEGHGTGTTFIIELPLHELTREEFECEGGAGKNTPCEHTLATSSQTSNTTDGVKTSIHPSAEDGPPAEPSKGKRILVAEDAVSSLKMMIRLLERAGHTCVGAENGQQAIDAMKLDLIEAHSEPDHVPFDCVLLDFEMPLVKGPEAAQTIRKMGFERPIVGITGNILSEDVEYFKAHGADEVLPKPVSMAMINNFWDQQENGGACRRQQQVAESRRSQG